MYYFWLLLGTIPYAITKPTRSDQELTALNRQDEPGNGQELINTPSNYDGIERAASTGSGVEYAYRDVFIKSNMESCPKYYDYYATLTNFLKENDKFEVRCSSTWDDLGDRSDGLRDDWGTVVGTPFASTNADCADDASLYCCNSSPVADDIDLAAEKQRHYCVKITDMVTY